MKLKKIKFPSPTERALKILVLELALVTIAALAVFMTLLVRSPNDAVDAAQRYLFDMEYILTSLVIAVGGFVLTDLCEREQQKDS